MYLEMLHEVVGEILNDDKEKLKSIEIALTPGIYDTLQMELNDIIRYDCEVPIEGIHAVSIILYKRSVTLIKSPNMHPRFENKVVGRLAKLSSMENEYKKRSNAKDMAALENDIPSKHG